MIDPKSRYAAVPTKTLVVSSADAPEREIRYLARRFPPLDGAGPTLVEHVVAQEDRLDRVSARYLGDPLQFWRIADANAALAPEELCDSAGERISIALPRM